MDTSKIGFGDMVAAASALLLFLFLFLPWYGLEVSGNLGGASITAEGPDTFSAWESFSFVDILLFLLVLAVIGLVAAKAAGALPDLPQPSALIIAEAGGVALLLVLFRLLATPDVDVAGLTVDVDATRKIGVFLALIAAAGITYGGWLGMSESESGAAAPRA